MLPDDDDGLWAMAQQALELASVGAGLMNNHSPSAMVDGVAAVESDEEDAYGNNVLLQKARTCQDTMIRLPDGDIHLCGCDCNAAVANKDGDLVCPHSGLVVGYTPIERTDFSTGRSTWSADPDMHGGAPVGGAWRKKIDRKAASQRAHMMASTFDDTAMPRALESARSSLQPMKRGALCVDEAPPEPAGSKRSRTSRKEIESNDQLHSLIAEASSTFSKLMSIRTPLRSSKDSSKAPVDTRLLNSNILFNASLRKYLKETIARGARPNMDEIHNIALAVEEIVAEERRKSEQCKAGRAGTFASIRFRDLVSRLAVSLWISACKTPYMDQARRGGDSFRPFCCGVFYSLKRGLTIGDGSILVPAFASFADALPSQRDVASNPAAKSLHASSHRGMCSIHRCISSVGVKEQRMVFADTINIAREFLARK